MPQVRQQQKTEISPHKSIQSAPQPVVPVTTESATPEKPARKCVFFLELPLASLLTAQQQVLRPTTSTLQRQRHRLQHRGLQLTLPPPWQSCPIHLERLLLQRVPNWLSRPVSIRRGKNGGLQGQVLVVNFVKHSYRDHIHISYCILLKIRIFSCVDVRQSIKLEQKRESSIETRYHSNGSDTKERTPDKKSGKSGKHKSNKGSFRTSLFIYHILFKAPMTTTSVCC